MFATRYFAGHYFTRRYFPAVGAAIQMLDLVVTGVRPLTAIRGVRASTPLRSVRLP